MLLPLAISRSAEFTHHTLIASIDIYQNIEYLARADRIKIWCISLHRRGRFSFLTPLGRCRIAYLINKVLRVLDGHE